MRALTALFVAAMLAACSSSDAPLGGGGTGSARGSGAGGGGGTPGTPEGGALTSAVLGLVTFEDRPGGAAAAVSTNVVSARFLEGAYGDADAGAGALVLPAGCTERTVSVADTTCRRIDCPQIVSTEPVGVERSAGRLTLGGLTGADLIDPTPSGTYTPLTSTEVPFWQGGASLDVSAAGDVVPAFTATVTAVPALTLVEPVDTGDGTRNLSRSVGLSLRLGETVQTLRLTLAFSVALDGGAQRIAFDCSAPGTSGTLTVPAELVLDLPDDSAPVSGELVGEISTSVPLGPTDAPVGRAIVAARRIVTAADQSALDWKRFVLIP